MHLLLSEVLLLPLFMRYTNYYTMTCLYKSSSSSGSTCRTFIAVVAVLCCAVIHNTLHYKDTCESLVVTRVHEEVVTTKLLFSVFYRISLVDTRSEVSRITSKCDAQQLQEGVHACSCIVYSTFAHING
jgi:hypothetical protein